MKNVKWWQKAVVYQIYPQSFQDSNGDGYGDLRGIVSRLDYLTELGVDTIWLCPVNASPMYDNGYDISDYYQMNPRFGTMEDMDLLLNETKKRGIRIIMDLVVNHCSSEHEWFQKALKDPEGPYGKYFYFKKGVDGKEPNNWRSIFGGSVWEPVPGTDYYYLHSFVKEQPDLNWENQALREEIYKMMNYWLDKGVAGFRLDAITYLKKEEGLPSYPADADDGLVSLKYGSLNKPGIGAFLTEMRDRTYGRYDAMTVGEVAGAEGEEMLHFISLEDGYFSMIFEFSSIELDTVPPNYFWFDRREWDAEDLKAAMFPVHEFIQPKGWVATTLENHDSPRSIDYYLPEAGRNFYGGSMIATMELGLRGTPFIYQGQELGMTNFHFASIDQYDDCSSHNQYAYALAQGLSPEEALHCVHLRSRDNARYPFSWDESEHAGFTTGTPWLPAAPNRDTINAKAEMEDENSLFHYYKRLIQLRKSECVGDILSLGAQRAYLPEVKGLVAFERYLGEPEEKGNILILCNYQNEQLDVELPAGEHAVLLDNYKAYEKVEDAAVLQPFQALVIRL